MKHTQGKWYSTKDTLIGVTYINCKIHNGAIIEIARICISAHDNSDHSKWTETLANAKLMAAAPELLKALKELTEALHGVESSELPAYINALVVIKASIG